ncbi:hypothetical protein QTP70_001235 [Hemibagrus guttatus]|uniref:Reverse transcriptase domain-containing protein n=1 Tax=Hemibagrus guttatus TaxID=175788 RepID=A0AAE0UVI2_9TELE|nr:hypothetical protein QTP70_001235 [Hemibagrus guttatus]
MTVVGLISKNDESAYREEVQQLTAWCKANNLSLNVEKTKDMVVDSRRAQSGHSPLFIDGSSVEEDSLVGTIHSILSSCITAWFGNCTISDRKTLQRIVRTAEKIIGVSLPSITDMYTTRCTRKANSIDDSTHPSHTLFTLLPSGKSYTSHSQAPSILSFQCDHWLYPRSESRRLMVFTDAVDGSVWTACDQETAEPSQSLLMTYYDGDQI